MILLSNDPNHIIDYLDSNNYLEDGEKIILTESPGAGNMNFTLRVKTSSRSFILKQSRDYVEKYPQVAAPKHRVLMEAQFYEAISGYPSLNTATPDVFHVDKMSNVLIIQDLGNGTDYTHLYDRGSVMTLGKLKPVIDFLTTLHSTITTETDHSPISNTEMRKLNHQHIFVYPYAEDNGLNLDDILEGLQEESLKYKQDEELKKRIAEIGELYLAEGDTLLHGDYFPGSWLEADEKIHIIDPEFCFFGPREFELGVLIAHLMMADQSEELIKYAREQYLSVIQLDEELLNNFIGVEILRRILGLAQLPLSLTLDDRRKLLLDARKMIIC